MCMREFGHLNPQHQGHQEKPDPAGSVCSPSVFTTMIASTKATKETRSSRISLLHLSLHRNDCIHQGHQENRSSRISLLHISLHRNDCMHQGHQENQIQQDQFAPHQTSQQWLHPPRPPRKPDPAGSVCSTSVYTAMIACTKATKKTRSSRISLLHLRLHSNDCIHQGHQENQIQQDHFAPHQSTPQWLHAPRPPRKPDPAGSFCSTSVYTAMIASTKATKKTKSSRISLLQISLHRNDCMHQGHQENQMQRDQFAPHQSSQQWLHPPFGKQSHTTWRERGEREETTPQDPTHLQLSWDQRQLEPKWQCHFGCECLHT